MTHTPDITRPPKDLIDALREIGAATVAGTLGHMGFRNPHMVGPVAQNHGKSIVGPALTLQFLPQRPDLFSAGAYADPETQLAPARAPLRRRAMWSWSARGDMSQRLRR